MAKFKLNMEKATEASKRRELRDDLKPEGLYEVILHAIHFFADDNKTPAISLELKIVKFFGKERGGKAVVNGAGKFAFANGRLFYKAFISEAALFGLQDIHFAYTGEDITAEELVTTLNGMDISADSVIKWVKSFTDASNKMVWVTKDTESNIPSNRIYFQNR